MPSFYIGRCFGSSTPASSCQESLPYAPSPPKSSSPVQGSCRHGGFATQYLNPQKASDVHLVPAQQFLQSHRNSHNTMKRKFEAETGNYCSAKQLNSGKAGNRHVHFPPCHSSTELIYFKINYQPSCKTLYWQLLKTASPSSS